MANTVMIEDVTLLRDYAERKSEAAFAELVQRRIGLVYTVALRQVGGDTHLAQDVAQKVFVELARKASSLTGRSTLAGWLHRTSHHMAIDVVRAECRRRAREQREPLMPDPSDRAQANADWDRLRPILDGAMSELNHLDRDAVALRFFEGRTFSETGRALRVTEEAARKRVERALDKMAGSLARCGITSTSAAISVVLADYATAAAPGELARMVTASALASGGTGGMSSGISFLTPAKVSVAVGILAVAAMVAIVYETNRAERGWAAAEMRQRERDIYRDETAALRRRLVAADQRAQAAEDDTAKLLAAISAAHARPAATPASVAAKETPVPQLRLALIQLSRAVGETDASLITRANAVLARFYSGESFASLAATFSADRRKSKGGDWGWQTPKDLRPNVSEIAFRLNKGEVSAPILMPEGCFILYAEDRR